jgi:hypothetical protein
MSCDLVCVVNQITEAFMRSTRSPLFLVLFVGVTVGATGCAHLEKLGLGLPSPSSRVPGVDSAPGASSLAAASGAPSWCASWDRSTSSGLTEQTGFTEDNLGAASTEPCAHHGEAAFVNQSRRFLDTWRRGTGLGEQEVAQSMSMRADQANYRAALAAACKPLEALGETDKADRPKRGTALERARAAAWSDILDCKETGRPVFDPLDVDADSQLVRVAVVARCYDLSNHLHDESSALQLGEEAGCAADATLLDRAKFEAELKSLGANATVATRAREFFARTWTMSRWTLAHLKDDADAWEVVVKAPLAARAAYAASAARHKAGLEAAVKWDDARVAKKAMTGCDVELGAAFSRISQKAATDSEEHAADLFEREPVAWRVMSALVACHAALGNQELAGSLERTWLWRARTIPGPRAAMSFALLDAKVDKDLDFTPHRNVWSARDNRRSVSLEDGSSVVASVKPAPGGVQVDFTADFIELEVLRCKETNKIHRILPDGQLEYRQDCVVVGTEKKKVQEKSLVIPKAFATGVQPGRYMSFHRFADERSGAPRGVYAGKKPEKLVAVAGFPVKP